ERAGERMLENLLLHESGCRHTPLEPSNCDRFENLLVLRPVAVDLAGEIRDLLARPREGWDERGNALLRDVPTGEDGHGPRGHWLVRGGRARVLPFQAC